MTEFVLVSCSKSKKSGIHRAADLYEPSRIFRKRREFAQERGDHWGVLSAKHGYLRPWDTIEKYERHISDRTNIWGALALKDLLRDLEDLGVDTVTVLAGSKYVEPLVTELEAAGYDVIDYNNGLRPGERYSKLKNDLQPGEQQQLVTDGGSVSHPEARVYCQNCHQFNSHDDGNCTICGELIKEVATDGGQPDLIGYCEVCDSIHRPSEPHKGGSTDGGLVAEQKVTNAFLRARLATAYRTEGEILCDACEEMVDLSKGSLATAIAAWNDHAADCGGGADE